jgi:type IV pilus assembly protein PilA
VAGTVGTTGPVTVTGPVATSTKAIVSLVCGLFIFFFPLSLAAVILGHLSLSEIKKNAGRITGEGLAMAGLVLGYVGVAAIPVTLILAAIAIPNLLRARMAANETSAAASIRTITAAQVSYWGEHPEIGYACSLSSVSDAQKIDSSLGSGQKNGYRFEIIGCVAGPPGGANTKYQVVAYPIKSNQTGGRVFCSDESAVIKQHSGGSGQNCLESGVVLQ